MDVSEVFRAYGLEDKDKRFLLTINYFESELPHSLKIASKATQVLLDPERSVEILKLIKDTLPKDHKFSYVYTYIGGVRTLIFDDSSFVCLYFLHKEMTKIKNMSVYIDFCAAQPDRIYTIKKY